MNYIFPKSTNLFTSTFEKPSHISSKLKMQKLISLEEFNSFFFSHKVYPKLIVVFYQSGPEINLTLLYPLTKY